MNRPVNKIQREITPLSQGDCLLVLDRVKGKFDFPVHFHPEFKLDFIQHAANAEQIVSDHKSMISETELVLVGPNLYHGWNEGHCKSEQIHEITIQFHRDLIHESLLTRNMMKTIRELLNNASHGILFSEETTQQIAPQLQQLSRKNGLDAFIELILILLTEAYQTTSEIAVCCGFYNISNFNRIFKKNIGCTPANTARIFQE